MMEVDIVTEGASEDDAFMFDQVNDDDSNFEGERCGICMTIVVDRGILDCCQHWFCFTCIDNWATITNLCPLCQSEFQLITCIPVYDTIGGNKADEDSLSGEDDWFVEGANNTLTFPSYYIDENAVICLDGDGCKIRSGHVTVVDDSNLDTSIACDSCDIWYHAFCVGFDSEKTCESWLCPRCVTDKDVQKSNVSPTLGSINKCPTGLTTSDCLVEAALSGKVSVSVADAGETAVVVSMVQENHEVDLASEKLSSASEVDKDMNMDISISSSSANCLELQTPLAGHTSAEPVLAVPKLELCLSENGSCHLPFTLGQRELKTATDKLKKEPSDFERFSTSSKFLIEPSSTNEACEPSTDLHLGLSVSCCLPVSPIQVDVAENAESPSSPEELSLPAGQKIEPDLKKKVDGKLGVKRKLRELSDDVSTVAADKTVNAEVGNKAKTRKVKNKRNDQVADLENKPDGSHLDGSRACISVKQASDIRSIVQGTIRRSSKGHACSKERENGAGLRVKKIMRRAGEDKESSMLVQKLRTEIREAVRNKTAHEFGEKIFDTKLLAAFRTAVSGSVTGPPRISPAQALKAKKLMLQKGKVRENLTKKIYSMGGRRKRAWTRDCEIEFWKHRCMQAGKPEKIETLMSVLNLLRKNSDDRDINQPTEGKDKSPILSRLYLADASVFPRKEGIKPLSDSATGLAENNGHSQIAVTLAQSQSKALRTSNPSVQVNVPLSGSKMHVKKDTFSSKIPTTKRPEEKSSASSSASRGNTDKTIAVKQNDVKKDKKQWALEILARKQATIGSNSSKARQEDKSMLKGNYPLLAQLPSDMRPVLASSRHNKIPVAIRQAQLHRLTEHLLRKANLPIIRRTADTEFAVADAINIEKEIADRSNSKLVYVNLMSQELLNRPHTTKDKPPEPDSSPTTTVPSDRSERIANDISDVPTVEEALRNAGLISDSPPNSPSHQTGETNKETGFSEIDEEEPDNVFEIDSHPEVDIYGDFEYDLEDEDLINSSALKVSTLQKEESKMKVLFSSLDSNQSTNAVETVKDASCLDNTQSGSSSVLARTEDCASGELPLTDNKAEEPCTDVGEKELSDAECEELYGPDKEPLLKRFPAMANIVIPVKVECSGSSQKVKEPVDETATSCSQTSDNVPVKELLSSSSSVNKKSNSSISSVKRKVEAYIKEHIRPLCMSKVITIEQYRWAVGKTTDKVMKHHSKEKSASFLIKEGDKVKKLAAQYVEASQQMEKK